MWVQYTPPVGYCQLIIIVHIPKFQSRHSFSCHNCWDLRAVALDGRTNTSWTLGMSPCVSASDGWSACRAWMSRGYNACIGCRRPVAPTWIRAPLTLPSELTISSVTLANFQKVLGWSALFTRTMSPTPILLLSKQLPLWLCASLSPVKYSFLHLVQKWSRILLRCCILLERSVGDLGTTW